VYAVVFSGGKQYKLQEGETVRVEKIPGKKGSSISFEKVLLYSDGRKVTVGRPFLDDIAVKAHIVEQGKAKKIIVFKYKRRKRYRRKQGHRQPFTAIQIDNISGPVDDPEKKTTK